MCLFSVRCHFLALTFWPSVKVAQSVVFQTTSWDWEGPGGPAESGKRRPDHHDHTTAHNFHAPPVLPRRNHDYSLYQYVLLSIITMQICVHAARLRPAPEVRAREAYMSLSTRATVFYRFIVRVVVCFVRLCENSLRMHTRLVSNSAPMWSSTCCFTACHF